MVTMVEIVKFLSNKKVAIDEETYSYLSAILRDNYKQAYSDGRQDGEISEKMRIRGILGI